MAQIVGFFSNNVEYEEGPFVLCVVGGHYRLEAEFKGHNCPVLPTNSVYILAKKLGLTGKTWNKALAIKVCDTLNSMVKAEEIILDGKVWVYPPFEVQPFLKYLGSVLA